MRTMMFALLLLISAPAFADTHEMVAFERFKSEVSSASEFRTKQDSALAYFETLDRVGAGPKSTGGCLKSISLGGSGESASCFPIKIEARGGTGGVD